MKLIHNIRAIKYYVLRIDAGDPETCQVKGEVFGRVGDQLDSLREIAAQSLEEILAQIPKRSRLLLLLTGDQVLTRSSEDPDQNLFEELEEEDFYLQQIQTGEGGQMQSACRKSVVDPLVQLVAENKHFLLDVSLGESSASVLAVILHYFQEGPAEINSLAENESESSFFRLFQRVAMACLAFFFTLLLANFLVFNHIQQKLDRLRTSGENLSAKVEQIEQLKAQISEFRSLTGNQSLRSEETYSYYLDELALIRPQGVWYNRLSLHPLGKRQESNKALELDPSLFTLYGETRDPVSLNRLIISLEEMDWVQDIELRNYETLTEKSGAGFILAIRKAE